MKEIPHYGNDLDYPDEIAEWISKVITDKVRSCVGPRGNHWQAGALSRGHARRVGQD